MATIRRHYFHSKRRGDLWVARRTDRDRTTARIELTERVLEAIWRENPRKDLTPTRIRG